MASTINALTSGGGLAVSGDTSGSLQLQTNNGTTAMTIDTSQNVGIGTTSPGQKLHIASSSPATYIQFQNATRSDGYIGYDIGNMEFFTVGSERMRIDSSGTLLVGTASGNNSGAKVYVLSSSIGQSFYRNDTTAFSPLAFYSNTTTLQGYITCTGAGATSYVTTSDQRLKENITDAPNSLNIINSIKVRSFDWKESKVHQDFGFVAQELIEIAPDAVAVNQDEFKTMGVDASKLVPYLVKAIQEQQAIITDLKARIETLEGAKA